MRGSDVTNRLTLNNDSPGDALAGDYMVTLRATGDGVHDAAEFRVTVRTSTVWGIVAVGIIAVALLVIVIAVMRYGRR